MSEPTTSDVLREAAKRIMDKGWWDGSVGAGEVECLAVAIGMAGRLGTSSCQTAWIAIADHLGIRDESHSATATYWNLTRWNDDPARTAEDVILALKQCAADLEDAS